MMNKVFVGIGSNVGDRLGYFNLAVSKLNTYDEIKLVKFASLYETRPYGDVQQNNFLNSALMIETGLLPDQVLKILKETELKVGRLKREKWGPREIDLDILLFGDLILNSGGLMIPHPELIRRDFVLAPLLEIEPGLVHPESKKMLKQYLDTIVENYILKVLKTDNWNNRSFVVE